MVQSTWGSILICGYSPSGTGGVANNNVTEASLMTKYMYVIHHLLAPPWALVGCGPVTLQPLCSGCQHVDVTQRVPLEVGQGVCRDSVLRRTRQGGQQ